MYQLGNPNKNPIKDPILEDAIQVTCPVAVGAVPGTVSTTYTVPTGRGRVQGIEIFVDSVNQTELSKSVINISGSQKGLLVNSYLIRHSSPYNNNKKSIVCTIEEQVQCQIQVSNLSTTVAPVVTIVFIYYNDSITAITEYQP